MSSLSVESLCFHTLGPFSFAVEAGECVALSGPSGAGKSLLLRALVDLDPHEGTVQLDGVADSSLPAPEWRRRLGMLPANPIWWHPTVTDHFAVDAALLDELGFPEEAAEWSVARLSAGESQRLALARLLAQDPAALLLDEPTAHLDSTGTERVEALLDRKRRDEGLAIIWVSHDPAQIDRIAERTLHLEEGQLEERRR